MKVRVWVQGFGLRFGVLGLGFRVPNVQGLLWLCLIFGVGRGVTPAASRIAPIELVNLGGPPALNPKPVKDLRPLLLSLIPFTPSQRAHVNVLHAGQALTLSQFLVYRGYVGIMEKKMEATI